MTTFTSLLVSAHQDELLAQAAAERLAASARTQVASPNRLASAAKSVWSFLSGPADRPVTPTLVNYPYRG